MLFSLSPWQQPISPWSSDRNPICVRGLARERLFSLQGCSLRKDESSLNFTMLLRLESLFPLSVSPPLAGGNIAILLGVILLDLHSCILPVFQTLGVRDSWDLSVFFDSCGLSWLLRTSLISWFLGLVVPYASCSLPDSFSLPDSGSLPDSLGLQTFKAVLFILKTFTSFKEEHINKHSYTCL